MTLDSPRRSGVRTETVHWKRWKGTYIFAPQGFQVQDGQQLPIALAGTETFDGKGHVEGQLTQSINGEISRVTYRGTYTITPDCVGTETITDSTGATSHYDQFVSPDGKEFTFIQTDPGIQPLRFRATREQTAVNCTVPPSPLGHRDHRVSAID